MSPRKRPKQTQVRIRVTSHAQGGCKEIWQPVTKSACSIMRCLAASGHMLGSCGAYILVERRGILVVNDDGVQAGQAQGAAVIQFHAAPLLPTSQPAVSSITCLPMDPQNHTYDGILQIKPCDSLQIPSVVSACNPCLLQSFAVRGAAKADCVHMAPEQAIPGSQALAGGALRGAVLPVAHAEALLLEEAVHAMLHSTMHQQAARDQS